jgi:hypothetical protein
VNFYILPRTNSDGLIITEGGKIKCYNRNSNTQPTTYIIYLFPMTLTTELTGHVIMATLTVYNTSERHTELKRKMFGMLDGGLGQLWSACISFSS